MTYLKCSQCKKIKPFAETVIVEEEVFLRGKVGNTWCKDCIKKNNERQR